MKKVIASLSLAQIALGLLAFRYANVDIIYKCLSIFSFSIVSVGALMKNNTEEDVGKLKERLIDAEKELLKSQQNGATKKHIIAD